MSMEEVIGRNGINAVLNLSSLSGLIENYPLDNANLDFPFSTVSSLTNMLEQVYGPHGGRGLALRIGRACFNYGLRQYGKQLGLMEMTFRLL
ncbi:MAG TPA: 4-vinyl reductase, partial [Anaerolineales bacterium]|nr:4-vinyl reductase [Anaerolineales bacterium]